MHREKPRGRNNSPDDDDAHLHADRCGMRGYALRQREAERGERAGHDERSERRRELSGRGGGGDEGGMTRGVRAQASA